MNPKDLITNAARGFAMGAADIVPGVSGGTIALILGIYERLLASIRTGARSLGRLARGDVSGFIAQLKAIEWSFIGPLLVGIVAAFVVLASILDRLLTNEPEAMAGLFFGLVVASILVAWQMLHNRDSTRMSVLMTVGIVAFYVLGLQSGSVSDPGLILFFFTGAIAICAMILPGISGSFLMLMLGMYAAFVGAVHDRELTNLVFFVLGALAGLAAFSTLLSWILDHHRDTLLAALIGLMGGSLRVLWPWPNGVGTIEDNAAEQIDGTTVDLPVDLTDGWLPVLLGIVAFAIVVALNKFTPAEA
ncbi:MAG: putative membrane protein [Paracrocinitomix sp.]